MLFLVKLFPEITVKSRPVRKRLVRLCRRNLKIVLSRIDEDIVVNGHWDCLEVETGDIDTVQKMLLLEALACTPGVDQFLEVDRFPLPTMAGILEIADRYFGPSLPGKTFAVRCKRMGRQSFKSVDVEQAVGAGLNLRYDSARVKLEDPEVTVALEVREQELFVVKQTHAGLGGYPLGGQDAVLSLLSGGFDSAVSSYMAIKRGLLTHFCFFNMGGRAHELAVKEVALYLWMKYHSSHRIKFVTVPFEGVVEEILVSVEDSQMGVVLKRLMLRAADGVAQRLNVHALVTGESVAQVASQTLANLSVIDEVSELMVLRPLCMTDKQTIINKAREIGTEEFSKHIPEYCAVISGSPTTKAKAQRLAEQESRFDWSKLDEAIAGARFQLITEVVEDLKRRSGEMVAVKAPLPHQIIIDIRHPDEVALKPFNKKGLGNAVLSVPFFKLKTSFADLDSGKHYLLYCDQGMMSRLHAGHLIDEGFANVGVLDARAEFSRQPKPSLEPA